MPILYAMPTLPQAPSGPNQPNMAQPDFYQQQQQQQQQQPQISTSDYIKAQIDRVKNRAAPPNLTPGSRVVNVPQEQLAGHDNFQYAYDQLSAIRQISQQQLAQAQAQAALAQIKAQQALNQVHSAANPGGTYAGVPGATQGGSYGPAGSAVLGGSVPSNPKANFQYAQNIAGNYGWNNASELAAWYQLGMNESGWNNNAQNPTSTAYGIGQFLNSTWAGYGIPKTSNPALQVEAMARYIKARYGSPSKALAAWNSRSPHWY